MKHRKFGDTDLVVSEICFGPMRFAARAQGEDEFPEEEASWPSRVVPLDPPNRDCRSRHSILAHCICCVFRLVS